MHLHLLAPLHISLRRLVPAFTLSVRATQGRTIVCLRGYERLLAPGQSATVPAFEGVALHLLGNSTQAASCLVELYTEPISALGKSLHHHLSRCVFLEPHHTWNATFVAERFGISPARTRRILFSQGTALTDLCRTQRLMRTLFDILTDEMPLGELKRRGGWPTGYDLEAAFHDRFGLTTQAALRLASGLTPRFSAESRSSLWAR